SFLLTDIQKTLYFTFIMLMMSSQPFKFLPLLALLLLAGFLLFLSYILFQFYSNQNLSSLTVSHQVERKVKPDEATITLTLEESGEDVTKLNAIIDEKTQKIIDFLKTQSIDFNKVTTNKTSQPNRIYNPDGSYKDTQIVQNSFVIVFDNIQTKPEVPNTVIKELTNRGVKNYSGFNYKISNSKQICEELEKESFEKALNKAKDQINGIKGRFVKAEFSNQGSYNCEQNPFGVMPMMKSSDAIAENATPIIAGEQTITVNGNVKAYYR
ncbi:MAG: SIMPL domain-containing protein, partial [Patescibacteria group bacterium]